jgi:hypothetical protein
MEEEERRDDSAIFSLRKKEKRHARTTAHLEQAPPRNTLRVSKFFS